MNETEIALPDWARALGPPAAVARARVEPQDFVVHEHLGFAPDDDGEHDLLHVEKTGLTTPQVAELLGRFARVSPRTIGYAGLKDRRAVTRQWFTVARPKAAADWSTFDADGRRVA